MVLSPSTIKVLLDCDKGFSTAIRTRVNYYRCFSKEKIGNVLFNYVALVKVMIKRLYIFKHEMVPTIRFKELN